MPSALLLCSLAFDMPLTYLISCDWCTSSGILAGASILGSSLVQEREHAAARGAIKNESHRKRAGSINGILEEKEQPRAMGGERASVGAAPAGGAPRRAVRSHVGARCAVKQAYQSEQGPGAARRAAVLRGTAWPTPPPALRSRHSAAAAACILFDHDCPRNAGQNPLQCRHMGAAWQAFGKQEHVQHCSRE